MFIREPEREIIVLDQVDVLVAGAGVAGCAAAIAAARTGAKTMLLERSGALGGVATVGLMANIGNLFVDQQGRSVIDGIAREVVQRLVVRGAASEHWAAREVPGCVIDSEQLKVLLIEMLREAGVTVLTHVLATRPVLADAGTEGQRVVQGAFIETKVGRQAVLAKQVIDTTGEADLATQAGAPMLWAKGTASMEFKLGRVDLEALYQHFRSHPETFPAGMDFVKGFAEFERNWVERGILFFPHGGGRKWDLVQRAIEQGTFQRDRGLFHGLDAAGLYGLRGLDSVIVNANFWDITSLKAPELSAAELGAQEVCYYVADFFRKHIPGFERSYVTQLAGALGVRTSRAIEGTATLTAGHTTSPHPVYFDDVIGCAPAHARFVEVGEFVHSHTHDIPYGIMVPKEVDNLLVASGKSVSCEPQGLVRGMSTCMVLGQAAGAAAALAAASATTPRQLDVRLLQRTLAQQGVYLGDSARRAALGLA